LLVVKSRGSACAVVALAVVGAAVEHFVAGAAVELVVMVVATACAVVMMGVGLVLASHCEMPLPFVQCLRVHHCTWVLRATVVVVAVVVAVVVVAIACSIADDFGVSANAVSHHGQRV
jgi:hypothetical protein